MFSDRRKNTRTFFPTQIWEISGNENKKIHISSVRSNKNVKFNFKPVPKTIAGSHTSLTIILGL